MPSNLSVPITVEIRHDVTISAYPISRAGHNECAAEIRTAFRHVFGEDTTAWPPWADHEIYELADKMALSRNGGLPRRN